MDSAIQTRPPNYLAKIGNCKNTELIDWLMPMWLQVIFALEQGEPLIEID